MKNVTMVSPNGSATVSVCPSEVTTMKNRGWKEQTDKPVKKSSKKEVTHAES